MIKIKKLDNRFIDDDNNIFDVFVVIESENELVKKGNFILDIINVNTEANTIELYINDILLSNDNITTKKEKLKKFIYTIDYHKNQPKVNSHIKNAWRNMQLDNLLNS
jgi:hypothetical protein